MARALSDIGTGHSTRAGNAQVINLSLGGTDLSADLSAAINYAASRNVLVIAAAGNCAKAASGAPARSIQITTRVAYPQVLAVAATDHYDNWASYSGYEVLYRIVGAWRSRWGSDYEHRPRRLWAASTAPRWRRRWFRLPPRWC